ncbi:MAG: hypothetical protein ACU0BB_08620 [Paracoccaceae bacterium]
MASERKINRVGKRVSEKICLEDFTNDDLVFFTGQVGLTLNLESSTFRLFRKIVGDWEFEEHPLSTIRSIAVHEVSPTRHTADGIGRWSKRAGQDIAVAIKNSQEKTSARRQTGLELMLRSVNEPRVFFVIPPGLQRDRLYEALSQVLEEGKLNGRLDAMPSSVRAQFHKATPEEKKKREKRVSILKQIFLPTRKSLTIFAALCFPWVIWVSLIRDTGWLRAYSWGNSLSYVIYDAVLALFMATIAYVPLVILLNLLRLFRNKNEKIKP